MSEVLGRVTTRMDVPRGPDVVHRIRVPRAWLESGEVVEFELPRNLSCAACDGGGCDCCERSGAISLRGRHELPELLQVTLPARSQDEVSEGRSVVIRIPEQGGLPAEGMPLPRGLLLLRVEPAEEADAGILLVTPQLPSVPVLKKVLSLRVSRPTPKQTRSLAIAVAIVIVLGLGLLAFLRLRALS